MVTQPDRPIGGRPFPRIQRREIGSQLAKEFPAARHTVGFTKSRQQRENEKFAF
jgi:hypothetical protein